jgi:hypothetical protein
MNAPLRHFAHSSLRSPVRGALACVGMAALLSGCAGNPFTRAAVDPSSPVAAEVEQMARRTGPFPTFADIPPVPTDQRPLAEWGVAANKLVVAAAQLERDTAPNTWTLEGTERFAARARQEAGPALDPGASRAATEAFARELRERATPPPLPR